MRIQNRNSPYLLFCKLSRTIHTNHSLHFRFSSTYDASFFCSLLLPSFYFDKHNQARIYLRKRRFYKKEKIIRATEDRKAETLLQKRGKESIDLIWLRLRPLLDSDPCAYICTCKCVYKQIWYLHVNAKAYKGTPLNTSSEQAAPDRK